MCFVQRTIKSLLLLQSQVRRGEPGKGQSRGSLTVGPCASEDTQPDTLDFSEYKMILLFCLLLSSCAKMWSQRRQRSCFSHLLT